MKKENNINVDAKGDFIFRYRIDRPQSEIADDEAVKVFFRRRIEALLDIVVLTCGEQDVSVDGFRFINDPSAVHGLFEKS